MYKTFYSLSHEPFQKEIETENLFAWEGFKEAEARLDYLLKTRGIGVLLGENGSGKTTVLRAFSEELSSSLYRVVYFPLSTGTVMDFYRGLAVGLGEKPRHRKVDLFHQIQDAVERFYHDQKVTPVFILDEMQLAARKFLNDLTILFNFDMDSQNPFVLILAGLPLFLDKLKLNQNQALNQRVVMQYSLDPLSKQEIKEYLSHQLELAGANHAIFNPQAVEAIALRTKGIPRLINSIAINSLLLGCQLEAQTINEEIVFRACEDNGL